MFTVATSVMGISTLLVCRVTQDLQPLLMLIVSLAKACHTGRSGNSKQSEVIAF